MLQLYSWADKHPRMAHTTTGIGAVFMPTLDTILHLKKLPDVVRMRDAEAVVEAELVRFC